MILEDYSGCRTVNGEGIPKAFTRTVAKVFYTQTHKRCKHLKYRLLFFNEKQIFTMVITKTEHEETKSIFLFVVPPHSDTNTGKGKITNKRRILPFSQHFASGPEVIF